MAQRQAPSAADVQHLLPRLQPQFADDMALLGLLRLFQRDLRICKVGAGILAVRIEEERVEILRQVLAMGDIPLTDSNRIPLLQSAKEEGQTFLQCKSRICANHVLTGQSNEIVQRSLFYGESATHIGLTPTAREGCKAAGADHGSEG